MVNDSGPSIGSYRGRDIPAWIRTNNGDYKFDRIAVETDDGIELSQLADSECVIAPGLVYRLFSAY